ncbi:MAG: J domain-containing protein, partial [Paraprevotella sp.]|nr:J domain-containing protein [Paraprevotella sp.]
CTVNIDMYTALLGGSIIVQTPEGDKLKLKIKPGTQPGTKVRLKAKGDTYADGTRGNLILTYNVQLPTNLTDKQKDLLQQMRMG